MMPETSEHPSIDKLAAHAVSAVRRNASTRPLPELRLRPPRRWVTPAVALATVVVVVVGLIAIGSHRDDAAANDASNRRWLVRDLPTGWRPAAVTDSAGWSEAPDASADLTIPYMYGTDAAPLGAMLWVQGTNDPTQHRTVGSYSAHETNYQEFQLDGQRAAFDDDMGGARGLYVEINGDWAYLFSRGLSDDALIALARTLTADVSGRYDVDPTAALSAGLHKVAYRADPQLRYTMVDYTPTGAPVSYDADAHSLRLSVAPSAADAFARSGLAFTAVTEGDFSGFVADVAQGLDSPLASWAVMWRRDGLDFSLLGVGVSRGQVLAAAASTSRASASEWSRLVDTSPVAPDETVAVPTGTAPLDGPVDTEPPYTGAPHDVDVTVSVDDVSANEQRWAGVLPTGEPWSATILRVYDQLEITTTVDGVVYTSGGTTSPSAGDQVGGCCQPFAITLNPDAVALSIRRADGDRYTVALHELPGTSGVRVALFAVTDTTGAEVVSTELVDAAGDVLAPQSPG